MTTTQQKRQIAFKVWISDLINSEYVQQSGEWEPNYVQIKDKRVSRVNVIATVIDKNKTEDSSYGTLIVDDGSDNISVKAWKEDVKLIENIEIGTSILIIGKIRQYNDQMYITPEIVKPLDKPEWVQLRKKELIKEYGEPEKSEPTIRIEEPQEIKIDLGVSEESVIEDNNTESERQKIMNVIETLDSEDGVDTEEIILNSKIEEIKVRSLLQELLKEGEIFEIKPGKVKIIE